jgi:hypothetical protein
VCVQSGGASSDRRSRVGPIGEVVVLEVVAEGAAGAGLIGAAACGTVVPGGGGGHTSAGRTAATREPTVAGRAALPGGGGGHATAGRGAVPGGGGGQTRAAEGVGVVMTGSLVDPGSGATLGRVAGPVAGARVSSCDRMACSALALVFTIFISLLCANIATHTHTHHTPRTRTQRGERCARAALQFKA